MSNYCFIIGQLDILITLLDTATKTMYFFIYTTFIQSGTEYSELFQDMDNIDGESNPCFQTSIFAKAIYLYDLPVGSL